MRLLPVTLVLLGCPSGQPEATPANPAWDLAVTLDELLGRDTGDADTDTDTDPDTDTDTDSGSDTSADSGGDSGSDTGLGVDTGDTSPGNDTGNDTGKDTGKDSGDPADSGDPKDSGTDTAPDSGSADSGDDGGGGVDSGDSGSGGIDTGYPESVDSGRADSGATGSDSAGADSGGADSGGSGSADTSTADTGSGKGSGGSLFETGAVPPDTGVYTPEPCDSGDTGGCHDVVRFVAIGDAGTGDARQERVAEAMEDICSLYGCDFALYLGDNFYGSGVADVSDPLWTSHFETPYAGLGFRFMAVLGNHDYGGFDTARAAAQVAYTSYSSKWYMPARFYTEVADDLTVVGLDTHAMVMDSYADQEAWIPAAIAGLSTTWSVAIGHHPYISNGPHGNAGEFDGRPGEGQTMKDFFDAYICGNVDMYIAGHDHTLQWLEPSCGTEQLVAGGGGAGTYPIVGTEPAYFEASDNGFLWVEINGRSLTGVFYDDTGAELYRQTITK
ncbi:MAG: metallophosphoesterase [Deltaproteobacteria bacterium]|nr:metallophosphoesterase [Deltaproteobacteria bacterium]